MFWIGGLRVPGFDWDRETGTVCAHAAHAVVKARTWRPIGCPRGSHGRRALRLSCRRTAGAA